MRILKIYINLSNSIFHKKKGSCYTFFVFFNVCHYFNLMVYNKIYSNSFSVAFVPDQAAKVYIRL